MLLATPIRRKATYLISGLTMLEKRGEKVQKETKILEVKKKNLGRIRTASKKIEKARKK